MGDLLLSLCCLKGGVGSWQRHERRGAGKEVLRTAMILRLCSLPLDTATITRIDRGQVVAGAPSAIRQQLPVVKQLALGRARRILRQRIHRQGRRHSQQSCCCTLLIFVLP